MLDVDAARRIAAAYPPEARFTPSWEREQYLTQTQQLAWLIRFDPEAAAEVMSAIGSTNSQQSMPVENIAYRIPHHENHTGGQNQSHDRSAGW